MPLKRDSYGSVSQEEGHAMPGITLWESTSFAHET
jgi:hypothetical protein